MNHRMLILFGICLLLLVGSGMALWGWLQLKAFLRTHASISSQLELDDLKRLVKTNMLLAVSAMVLFGLILILGAFGIYRGLVGWNELVAGLLILGPVCAVAGVKLTAAEKQVRKVPLEDETLREEFDHVLKRWTASMLPDW
ncbi:hypothetical protein ACFL5Q_01840 [Planctomycetota bacterium]